MASKKKGKTNYYPSGPSLATILRREELELVRKREQDSTWLIEKWNKEFDDSNWKEIVNKTFSFISVEYLVTTDDESIFVPGEIAVSSFSLKSGISPSKLHYFVKPKSGLPKGYVSDAKTRSEERHKIPFQGFENGRTDYENVLNEIFAYVRNNNAGEVLFCLANERKAVEKSLQYLANDTACNDDLQNIRIMCAEDLIYDLASWTESDCDRNVFLKNVENHFVRPCYDFSFNIRCSFHQSREISCVYCSSGNAVKVWFHASDILCEMYKIARTENHRPVEVDRPVQQSSVSLSKRSRASNSVSEPSVPLTAENMIKLATTYKKVEGLSPKFVVKPSKLVKEFDVETDDNIAVAAQRPGDAFAYTAKEVHDIAVAKQRQKNVDAAFVAKQQQQNFLDDDFGFARQQQKNNDDAFAAKQQHQRNVSTTPIVFSDEYYEPLMTSSPQTSIDVEQDYHVMTSSSMLKGPFSFSAAANPYQPKWASSVPDQGREGQFMSYVEDTASYVGQQKSAPPVQAMTSTYLLYQQRDDNACSSYASTTTADHFRPRGSVPPGVFRVGQFMTYAEDTPVVGQQQNIARPVQAAPYQQGGDNAGMATYSNPTVADRFRLQVGSVPGLGRGRFMNYGADDTSFAGQQQNMPPGQATDLYQQQRGDNAWPAYSNPTVADRFQQHQVSFPSSVDGRGQFVSCGENASVVVLPSMHANTPVYSPYQQQQSGDNAWSTYASSLAVHWQPKPSFPGVAGGQFANYTTESTSSVAGQQQNVPPAQAPPMFPPYQQELADGNSLPYTTVADRLQRQGGICRGLRKLPLIVTRGPNMNMQNSRFSGNGSEVCK